MRTRFHSPRWNIRRDLPLRTLMALACAASGAAFADPPAGGSDTGAEPRLPVTVVTADRIVEPLADSLSAVRVIDRQELESSGMLTLGEVLRQYGGVEIAATGGPGQPSSVFMRGANSNQTLVLVDGMRLQSATTGTTALENLPVAQIARIEVVPGPASGLYGSDAVGGVIQVFTKGASGEDGSEVTLGLGSFQTGQIQAGTHGHAGAVDYGVSAGYQGSDAFSATNPSVPFGLYNPDRDPWRDRNFSGRLGWNWEDGHTLGIRMYQSVAATHFDNGPATDDVAHQSLSQFQLTSQDRLGQDWTSELGAGVSRDYYYADAFGALETEQRQLGWQNTVGLGQAGTLVAGLEDLDERVGGDTVFSVTARDTRAGYLGWSAQSGPALLRASLRRADNSQFGGVTTGSLAAGWRIDEHWRVRASYGTGYHAPTFNDLYASYPPYYYANANLQPERSHNSELGIDVEAAGQHLGVALFDNRIHDLIEVAADPTQAVAETVLNVGSARIRGVELVLDGAAAGVRWNLRATGQQPVDEATGLRLSRRASQFASARVSTSAGGIDWSLDGQATGARYDSTGQATGTRMGGYGLLALVAAHSFSPEWRGELRWNNLLDHRYELVQGYNVPASSVFAMLTWSGR